MNQKKPSEDKKLLAMVKHFQEMKAEGKILYLDAEQYEEISDYYIRHENYKSAAEILETAMQIHPDNTRLMLARITLHIDEGEYKEARKKFDKIIDKNSFFVMVVHAELLFMEDKDIEAGLVIDSFDERDLDETECLDVGLLCIGIGDDEKAVYWLKKSLELDPENEEAIQAICQCYQELDQYEETIPLYNKLLDKDPYSEDCWVGLAESHFYLGQYDKAIEASDFALVINDRNGDAYLFKGHAYYQLENNKEAIEAYTEAWLQGSLQSELATMLIAYSYIGMEEWDNAYKYIQQARAIANEDEPEFPEILVASARCLYHLNNKEEANSLIKSVQERFPDTTIAWIYEGEFLLEEGNRDKALLNFVKAVNIDPSADTWFRIGLLAKEYKEYELALKSFGHVGEIDPDYENLAENILCVTNRFFEECYIPLDRKMLKKHIREIVAKGGKVPDLLDLDKFALQAKKDGKSKEEIKKLVEALKQLNDLIENYDIDQIEDEIY
ncbi:MAG: tetratricopeptide repeat protein [Mediterranea sp.]|jgi:tetratricopeptide (TPR) repeat protein|nr:tetratricopeptide repeat protein [Mediterranea sp.]